MNELIKRWETQAIEPQFEKGPNQLDAALEGIELAIREIDKVFVEINSDIHGLFDSYPELDKITGEPLAIRDTWQRLHSPNRSQESYRDDRELLYARYTQPFPVYNDSGEKIGDTRIRFGELGGHKSYEGVKPKNIYFYEVMRDSSREPSSDVLDMPSKLHKHFLAKHPTATGYESYFMPRTVTEKMGAWAVSNQFLTVQVHGIEKTQTEMRSVVDMALFTTHQQESGVVNVPEQRRLMAAANTESQVDVMPVQQKRRPFRRSKK